MIQQNKVQRGGGLTQTDTIANEQKLGANPEFQAFLAALDTRRSYYAKVLEPLQAALKTKTPAQLVETAIGKVIDLLELEAEHGQIPQQRADMDTERRLESVKRLYEDNRGFDGERLVAFMKAEKLKWKRFPEAVKSVEENLSTRSREEVIAFIMEKVMDMLDLINGRELKY